ncbi:MAG: acetylornithine/succinylornithine family transaminase [Clostridiales bacterium]|nr:acetylornithine/succinylornithine family transaminase [Clostridiales bacterium]
MDIIAKDHEYIAATYDRFPLRIVRGKGALVYDEQGNEYIDLGSGIAVNSFGVSDDEWVDAVTEQLKTCQHTSNLFYSDPCVLLAEKLCEISGMKKVFFSNSGAEANECAIKAARKYAAAKYGAERYNIITLKNSFHGRTITTLAATGQETFHTDYRPLTPGFIYVEVGDLNEVVEQAKTGRVAAVMFELIQGEGGVLPLPQEFVSGISQVAAEYGLLMIVDEVQTGCGRTGEYFAYKNYGITPDIVTLAKGLGGGLPIGATLLGEKVQDVFTPGSHGSTFGGNPVVCAGALNILSRINKNLLDKVKEKSDYIMKELRGAPGILGVTGMGLMIGIETSKPAAEVIRRCREMGVIVIKAKNKVRLLPPLNIPDDLLKKAVAVIKAACAE